MNNKIKVLIAEDEAITAMSLKIDLECHGIAALPPVATGKDAVHLACKEKPDLILMDIRLNEDMDGIEAAAEILKHHNIPIIFMTGFTTDTIKKRAIKLHPLDFLEKPLDMNRVKQLIDNISLEENTL
ncbi:MAG TPA: response regulator [bacterium]|nr:response regulator [bacterium]HPN41964.1 response regulator [bacterium]